MNSLSDLQSVGYSANAEIDNAGAAVSNSLSRITGSETAAEMASGNSDVVGIDGKEVPNLKKVIEAYVTTVNNNFEKINHSAATIGAFRGKYAEATSKFTQSIANACAALINQLLYFNNELDKVKAAFDAKSAAMALGIEGVSDDIIRSATGKDSPVQTSPTTNPVVGVSTVAAASVIGATTNPTTQTTTQSATEPSKISEQTGGEDNNSNVHSNFKQQIVEDQTTNKPNTNSSTDNSPDKVSLKSETAKESDVKTAIQNETVKQNTTKATNATSAPVGKKMSIPSGKTYARSHEPYQGLTYKGIGSYEISHGGTWNGKKYNTRTDPETGIRITNVDGKDYYLCAMGTYYGRNGDSFKITTDTGNTFDVMISDAKGTDSGTFYKDDYGSGTYYHNWGNGVKKVIEFVEDYYSVPSAVKDSGSYHIYDHLGGNITSIEKY